MEEKKKIKSPFKKLITSNPYIKARANVASSSGDAIYKPIAYKYDNDSKCMVPYFDKPQDRYAMIQASKAKVDINDIIKRAQCGDVSVLNMKHEIQLDDVSNMPDNLNDAHQLSVQALNNWSSLSPDVRKIFGNDLDVFMNAVEDGSYIQTINDALKPKEKENVVVEGDGK